MHHKVLHQLCQREEADQDTKDERQQEIPVDMFPELSYFTGEKQFERLCVYRLDGAEKLLVDAGKESDCSAGYTWNDIGCSHAYTFKAYHCIR